MNVLSKLVIDKIYLGVFCLLFTWPEVCPAALTWIATPPLIEQEVKKEPEPKVHFTLANKILYFTTSDEITSLLDLMAKNIYFMAINLTAIIRSTNS